VTTEKFGSLEYWFNRQDAAMIKNRSEIEETYLWLDSAVSLITDVQLFVNDDQHVRSIRNMQRNQEPEAYLASTLTVNMVNDALGCLVSSIRLMLSGAQTEAFATLRGAMESCCFAELFAIRPKYAVAFMELEPLLAADLRVNIQPKMRPRGLLIGSVMKKLQGIDNQDRTGFYARLCNLGSHASPLRVGLRMAPKGGAVTAAVSLSTEQWNRAWLNQGCASDICAVAKYALELLFEQFPNWFSMAESLLTRRASMVDQFHHLPLGSICSVILRTSET
jgi:hypothetical protein